MYFDSNSYPEFPEASSNGTYKLNAIKSNYGTNYSWVIDSGGGGGSSVFIVDETTPNTDVADAYMQQIPLYFSNFERQVDGNDTLCPIISTDIREDNGTYIIENFTCICTNDLNDEKYIVEKFS